MPTRNVVLTDHHEAIIEKLVRSGRYQNASEVLRDGLRLIEQRDQAEAARLEGLRNAIAAGLDDLERGEYQDFDSFDALAAYIEAIADDVLRTRSVR